MDCPSEDAIACFVEGALGDEVADEITRHLAECADCRALVSEMARAMPISATAAEFGAPRGHTLPFPWCSTVAPDPKPTFADGAMAADRYRIVRFLAEGGMGEVYEAFDIELRARVALKTVRPEIAANPKVLERFRREIYFARKVTHPNVCRIFDMGFHGAGETRIAFLTMEFLEGETLSERLSRGRMTPDEALPLVEQMVAGLSAAHREHVVHRDFKAPNVMLSPRADGLRAVITDFGLARGTAGDHFGSATTDHEGLVGSPAYMAPEQVAGLAVTARADTYALGVVLFEMVTGSWPFIDKTAVLTALKRLQIPAPSPRTLTPELDATWERVILRCLEREPEDRYDSVEEITRALHSTLVSHPIVDEIIQALAPVAPPIVPVTVQMQTADVPTLPSGRSPFRWAWLGAGSGAAIAIIALLLHRAPTSTLATPMTPAPAALTPPAPTPPALAPPSAAATAPPPPAAAEPTPPAVVHGAPKHRAHKPPPVDDHTLDHFVVKYPGK